jgi:hypothetical protein
MEKIGIEHIVCVKCSREAVIGTNPPLCPKHAVELEKKASEDPDTIREFADNPGDTFNV